MKDKIQKLREQFQDELGTVNASSSLEELRRNFLSKKGYVSGLMKELGKVPPEQKKTRKRTDSSGRRKSHQSGRVLR